MDTETEEQEPVVAQDANRPPEDLLMPYWTKKKKEGASPPLFCLHHAFVSQAFHQTSMSFLVCFGNGLQSGM